MTPQPYNRYLKQPARQLRSNQTDAELLLWSRLRRKQIHGVQFYRQKPLLNFIVDFYCPAARLIVECDGSQHYTPEHIAQDQQRTAALAQLGLTVLRFDNGQILTELDAVCLVIENEVLNALSFVNPPLAPLTAHPLQKQGARIFPNPPFKKEGAKA